LEGFAEGAEVIASAMGSNTANIADRQARTLCAMRAFYFMGVLRGTEAYRNSGQ